MTKEYSMNFAVLGKHSAVTVGSGLLQVLSTPSLLAFMENTCMHALADEVKPGESQVGIEANLQHRAASAIGSTVTVIAKLSEQNKQIYTFNIEAYEGDKLVGTAVHKRAIVNVERFMGNLE